ncbi:hypothetical protein BDV41DRAFT_550027 [Aspergillus transmontanensis]|uniref:Uncharacterized protein n=1 Tax=Aspergillus transmontanensis TaxID=1034304 RepID=A0A5N6VK38_9EURO|nr:hypothetical protein BDV41DRAFT_550027 [Aspergillus transmontanensis]
MSLTIARILALGLLSLNILMSFIIAFFPKSSLVPVTKRTNSNALCRPIHHGENHARNRHPNSSTKIATGITVCWGVVC